MCRERVAMVLRKKAHVDLTVVGNGDMKDGRRAEKP